MRKIWDFPGGIHPPENKQQSTRASIRNLPLPEYLCVPLQQHIGAPAQALVEPGQTVLKGQMLAEPQGRLSVAIHAPTSGIVESVIPHPVPHPSGMTDWCVVILPDGEERWIELEALADYRQASPRALLERIRQAGIAGMGGAGFPTEIKLHPPKEDKVKTLIVNGAECEPYITADDMLMRSRANEIVGGLEIMAYILEPEECLIGIEDNKPQAIEALQRAVEGTQIEIVVVPTKYPSGGEKQLIQLLTGLEVPHGRIPADIGVMCQNVGTAAAVYRAIRHGEPLISRITTLTGEGIAQKGNVETLIGTPISFLLEQSGFDNAGTERLIMGGPMMGFTLDTPEVPVIKTTNCVIAGSPQEFPAPPPAQPCIRCGMCAEVCPMELLPQQLFWFSQAKEFEKAEQHNLFDCIECGACSYVCPSTIPLVQFYRYAKGEIRQQREDQLKSDRARERFEARQARLEREQAEKEAKRKARAEAAAKAQAEKKAQQEAAPAKASASAAVQAALARKGVKAPETGTSTPEGPSIEELEKSLTKAKAKLKNMEGLLKDARTKGGDVEKLERAVAKNEQRVRETQAALHKAKADTPSEARATTIAEPQTPDLAELENRLDKAQAKLDNTRSMLDEARSQGGDNVEKLERAVAKNEQRVAVAEKALKEAMPSAPLEATQNQTQIAELEATLDKAKAKLETMQGMLEEARTSGGDNVDKLERAVAKNQDRVARAKQALTEARGTADTAS
ncbi:electron transport complex subunit RsxC [Marinobacter nanhaiticus D15-8W]|uniref:Ion-translocating oxidoreductase complex subunit C n=1 Tax=Marinobacter nanhaiticus D15-8W TaxID=626887 RepID=N6X093_9GAMM|nr:electron transport complex subunit RsxC [Marinobacter nanhaiticus]ENO14468.1 electron transport complex subunit RsxC [Marinobacter nanhaiticus D15-8W]BES71861.1 electron transport complex subunit RsxC [Marinobacter nanhaiticus D15-8W]